MAVLQYVYPSIHSETQFNIKVMCILKHTTYIIHTAQFILLFYERKRPFPLVMYVFCENI